MALEDCREKILSQDYLDFIVPSYRQNMEYAFSDQQACIQEVGFGYRILYIDQTFAQDVTIEQFGYNGIPNCYALLDSAAMNEAGISAVQNYPTLQLQGEGVMIGFLDTGIDYRNSIFRKEDGGTKIAAIWDQTIQTGEVPEGFSYGSEYTEDTINEALRSDNPQGIVPSTDTNGHGTFVASVAAGNGSLANGFQGAAPKATLAVVKLKPAKNFVKEFFAVKEEAICFQETDIMQGLYYLHQLALKRDMPLVICLALGTNFGGHNGRTALSDILDHYADTIDRCVIIGGGNEANQRHHYLGRLESGKGASEAELRVEQGNTGFVAELWTTLPNIVTAYLVSPSGERSPRISIRQGSRYRLNFPFDNTQVDIEYRLLLTNDDSQLIFMRFTNPSPGIWRIGVEALQLQESEYHIWTSMKEFLNADVYFLEANPDYTITEPGSTREAMTVSYYNGTENSVDINSGRGYTRNRTIKPDFAVPGVQITGASSGGRFVSRSGSSAAAGIAAGGAALVVEWLKEQTMTRGVSSRLVANIIILGANQKVLPDYPNREWGYGTMDIYQSLDRLRRL